MKTVTVEAEKACGPRKANESFIDPAFFFHPDRLFDEFWLEGELALLFGPSGAGKSVLTVQIADALARGRPIEGFRMPISRRKVLYVDLVLRDAQFQVRYSYCPPNKASKSYKFAENIYRDRPPANADLGEWISEMVTEHGFQAVIVDDLSAVKRTNDGVRETLSLMRRLKQISGELNVAILAVTASENPGRSGTVSESDLKRSRVLCDAADSVFAVGPSRARGENRCLVHLRTRNAAIYWDENAAPGGTIERLETGILGFRFDERFVTAIDDETRALICRIRALREGGKTYRWIAEELDISKTKAAALYKKWTPALAESEEDKREEWEIAGYEEPEWLKDDDTGDDSPPAGVEIEPVAVPQMHGLHRRSVYDLRTEIDDRGDELFIEKAFEHDGQPVIWYKFDKKGLKRRYTRNLYTIYEDVLDAGPYL